MADGNAAGNRDRYNPRQNQGLPVEDTQIGTGRSRVREEVKDPHNLLI